MVSVVICVVFMIIKVVMVVIATIIMNMVSCAELPSMLTYYYSILILMQYSIVYVRTT